MPTRAQQDEDERLARHLQFQEMARAGLVRAPRPHAGGSHASASSSSSSRNTAPQKVRAECPSCHTQNEFSLPYSPTPVTVRCGSCKNNFSTQMPEPPLMDIRLCRGCGEMQQYPLPPVGEPFPSVQCPQCGHITQNRGIVQSVDRRRAEVLSEAHDGPMVLVRIGSIRRRVPLLYLVALMAEEGQRSNAAGAQDIRALPIHKVDENSNLGNQTTCTICIEDFQDGDEIKTLPCLHIYHHKCIDSWLQHDNSCPVCKTPIGDRERALSGARGAKPAA